MWPGPEEDLKRQLQQLDRDIAEREKKQKDLEKTAQYNISEGATVGFKVGLFIDFGNLYANRGDYIRFMSPRLALAGAAIGAVVYAAKKIKPD